MMGPFASRRAAALAFVLFAFGGLGEEFPPLAPELGDVVDDFEPLVIDGCRATTEVGYGLIDPRSPPSVDEVIRVARIPTDVRIDRSVRGGITTVVAVSDVGETVALIRVGAGHVMWERCRALE